MLAPYGGPELAESFAPFYRESAEQGRYTAGEAELVSLEVTAYEGEHAGYEDVEFTACVNTSTLRMFEEDGTEIDLPHDTPEQYVTVYRLSRLGPEGDGRWLVDESTGHFDQEC